METRSQERGAPLKKPGAYRTDAYYQEMDQGYGDVGVGQEPDAGTLEDRNDPDFKPTGQEMKEADTNQAREDAEVFDAPKGREVDKTVNPRAELEDLKPTAAAERATDAAGEPVPVDQESGDEVEAAAAGYTTAE